MVSGGGAVGGGECLRGGKGGGPDLSRVGEREINGTAGGIGPAGRGAAGTGCFTEAGVPPSGLGTVGGGRKPPGPGREKVGAAGAGIFGGWMSGVGAALGAPGGDPAAGGGAAGLGLGPMGSKNSRGPTTVTSSSTKLGLSLSSSCSSTTVGC